jgi:hypothetical protein
MNEVIDLSISKPNQGISQSKPENKKKNKKKNMGRYASNLYSCLNCGGDYVGPICPACKTRRGMLSSTRKDRYL